MSRSALSVSLPHSRQQNRVQVAASWQQGALGYCGDLGQAGTAHGGTARVHRVLGQMAFTTAVQQGGHNGKQEPGVLLWLGAGGEEEGGRGCSESLGVLLLCSACCSQPETWLAREQHSGPPSEDGCQLEAAGASNTPWWLKTGMQAAGLQGPEAD